MSMSAYFTKQRLEELTRSLSARDRYILDSLKKCRYLTTLQIAQLYCGQSVNRRSAVRAANRCLTKLKNSGLICALERRIGGVRAGSGSYIWTLTSGGFRLLCLESGAKQSRKQFREPSLHFLEHTLIISEAYLQMNQICTTHQMTLSRVQFEPDCWRQYSARNGKTVILKPDLYVVTRGGGYEDCWFLEIDRATETPERVVDKCERYIQYLRTGAEQKQRGVFPYVVWIVPDEKRKHSLTAHIAKAYAHGSIFLVILPDELETLIVGGAAEYMKNSRSKEGFNDRKR